MKYLYIILLLIFSGSAISTMQVPEILIVDGKEYKIEEVPLEQLFPVETIVLKIENKQTCSASWRGYAGKWEVIKEELYLSSIQKDVCGNTGVDVSSTVLFPRQDYPIRARWYSGELTHITGKVWGDEVKMPSGQTLIENYRFEVIIFEFVDGVFIKKYTKIVTSED